jgi:hypothetical protein
MVTRCEEMTDAEMEQFFYLDPIQESIHISFKENPTEKQVSEDDGVSVSIANSLEVI